MRSGKEDMSELLARGVFPFDPAEGTRVLDNEMPPVLEPVEKEGHIFAAKSEGAPFVAAGDFIVGEAKEMEVVCEVEGESLIERPVQHRTVSCGFVSQQAKV
jgi:hypothetical protein